MILFRAFSFIFSFVCAFCRTVFYRNRCKGALVLPYCLAWSHSRRRSVDALYPCSSNERHMCHLRWNGMLLVMFVVRYILCRSIDVEHSAYQFSSLVGNMLVPGVSHQRRPPMLSVDSISTTNYCACDRLGRCTNNALPLMVSVAPLPLYNSPRTILVTRRFY